MNAAQLMVFQAVGRAIGVIANRMLETDARPGNDRSEPSHHPLTPRIRLYNGHPGSLTHLIPADQIVSEFSTGLGS